MQEIALRRPGGRIGLPPAPVPDDRHRRGRPVPPARLLRQARLGHRDRLPDRGRPLGGRRLHRDERRRALERADGRGRAGTASSRRSTSPSAPARSRACSSSGSACSASPATTGCSPDWLGNSSELGDRRPHRARVRRLADLGLRASRRRHLHEGRRRRRRPRRQDRGGNPRGRPAQPGRDRGQRGRQRRRLRRHGRRPLRDLRRHGRRRDAARAARSRPASSGCYPLAIGGISILASIIGTFFARVGRGGSIMNALYKAVLVATLLSAIGFIPVTQAFDGGHVQLLEPLRLGADRPRRHVPARRRSPSTTPARAGAR